MIDIKLTDTGDLSFANNDIEAITNETEAINQQIYITLQTALGEFQPDESLGVRQDNMFGRHVIIDYIKQDIDDALEDQVPGVDTVNSIDVELDYPNRTMNIHVTYTTVNQAAGDFSNDLKIGGA